MISPPLAALVAQIRAEHEAATATMQKSLAHSIAAGALLITAKKQLNYHGEWLPWLAKHCGIPQRTARRYMRLARDRSLFEDENGHVADLAVREAIDLIAGTATGVKRRHDPGNLAEPFTVPPFTVLDARSAEWQQRKQAWLALGIQSELGREGKPAFNQSSLNKMMRQRRCGLAAVLEEVDDAA